MTIKHNTCFSSLPPFHEDRYVSMSWPEDIQPHEAQFMAELLGFQMNTVKRIAANNVKKDQSEAEYASWFAGLKP